MVQQGEFKACRIGKSGIRIPERLVLSYLEARKVDPEAQYVLEGRGQSPSDQMHEANGNRRGGAADHQGGL
jgi:hypothetical protein